MDAPETKIANIGEMVMSDKPTVVLTVPNLGSCLGIMAWDSKRKLGAACHCLLPISKSNPEKAANQPFSFVDTGFCSLLEILVKAGCNPRELKLVVAGGSNMNDPDNVFQIGQKNITILRKLLWKNNLLMSAEALGGSVSRTISLHIGTGDISLRINGEKTQSFA